MTPQEHTVGGRLTCCVFALHPQVYVSPAMHSSIIASVQWIPNNCLLNGQAIQAGSQVSGARQVDTIARHKE